MTDTIIKAKLNMAPIIEKLAEISNTDYDSTKTLNAIDKSVYNFNFLLNEIAKVPVEKIIDINSIDQTNPQEKFVLHTIIKQWPAILNSIDYKKANLFVDTYVAKRNGTANSIIKTARKAIADSLEDTILKTSKLLDICYTKMQQDSDFAKKFNYTLTNETGFLDCTKEVLKIRLNALILKRIDTYRLQDARSMEEEIKKIIDSIDPTYMIALYQKEELKKYSQLLDYVEVLFNKLNKDLPTLLKAVDINTLKNGAFKELLCIIKYYDVFKVLEYTLNYKNNIRISYNEETLESILISNDDRLSNNKEYKDIIDQLTDLFNNEYTNTNNHLENILDIRNTLLDSIITPANQYLNSIPGITIDQYRNRIKTKKELLCSSNSQPYKLDEILNATALPNDYLEFVLLTIDNPSISYNSARSPRKRVFSILRNNKKKSLLILIIVSLITVTLILILVMKTIEHYHNANISI
ncbi:hypothetical protein NEOKW01_0263 [Nematocida sp. AWRm80]|nr:hypothetical protein NEOKW01_0263 [Nematocida sp. AWRm80]